MKPQRFAVQLDFQFDLPPAHAERLLHMIIEQGLIAFGHTAQTLSFSVEKMRQHKLDLDKPVGEKQT